MDKNKALKWLMLISFALVIIGGINWLFVGVVQVDIIALIFGGADSVVSRILYVLYGLAAVLLLIMVVMKSNTTKKDKKVKAAA